MCARRFLLIIFILTLLVVGAGFALFRYGQSVLIAQATPSGRFVAPKESGPDYRQAASWLARPGNSQNPADWLPDGVQRPAKAGNAAIFYIHPTTYLRGDRWTGPVDDGESGRWTNLFVQSQASAFTGAGEVWAPKYRQAAFGAFLLDSEDARGALTLAYSDVLRAFDLFVASAGNRPIILAGHSQGALHLTRLLKDRVAGKPLARRIVAAYLVGWPVSTTADLPAMGLPACRSVAETGCILSWLSFGDPANPDFFGKWEGSAGFTGGARRRGEALCVNPLTGAADGQAPAQANLGTLVPTSGYKSATLEPGRVSARCADGVLLIDGNIPSFVPPPLPGNNFHVYDYALFWGSIRADAERRATAFQGR
ncbi:DUF3089 domain-containing protein [Sphingomonas piscis]|uniref:DUF3089 domain-containing protein n=1 Tax=Sphingomonas piscis TaxID=2714943 RepID=A0A6G7YS59_9SPHN|nr:DUF3089 domain-containing protein [Sphingomonas piscis]QIK79561.1 DUF3089 domain-containing protein [Sphingomonas piscis]